MQLNNRTLELSPPPRPVDLSVISLGTQHHWQIHMFEHRDQLVLPVDPGPVLTTARVSDFGLSELDWGDFYGGTTLQVQCTAYSQYR